MFPGRLEDHDLLARLIAFESVSALPSRPICDFIEQYLRAAGCRTWRQDWDAGRKANLLAWRDPAGQSWPGCDESPASERPGLILSGHVDVVPAAEPEWGSPPFELRERAGRYLGRGTADMKGFVALAVNALAESPADSLRAPLALLLTSEEEVGCLGAQRFARLWVDSRPKHKEQGSPGDAPRRLTRPSEHTKAEPPPCLPRSVLIGEPTQMRVVRMHKGHLKVRLSLRGRPAHSGYPHLGESAIERAGHAILALTRLGAEWRRRGNPAGRYFPECPQAVLNIGLIRGGTAVNIIAASCELEMGIRLLPGQRSADALAEVTAALDGVADLRERYALDVLNDSPPMECAEDSPLVARLQRLLGPQDAVGVSFASDGGPLSQAGFDCVLCGPGSIEDAHQANESISIAEWTQAGMTLRRIIADFC